MIFPFDIVWNTSEQQYRRKPDLLRRSATDPDKASIVAKRQPHPERHSFHIMESQDSRSNNPAVRAPGKPSNFVNSPYHESEPSTPARYLA